MKNGMSIEEFEEEKAVQYWTLYNEEFEEEKAVQYRVVHEI